MDPHTLTHTWFTTVSTSHPKTLLQACVVAWVSLGLKQTGRFTFKKQKKNKRHMQIQYLQLQTVIGVKGTEEGHQQGASAAAHSPSSCSQVSS